MSKQFIFVRHERKERGGRGGGLEGGVSPLVSVRQSDLMDTSVTPGSRPSVDIKISEFWFCV